MNVEPRPSAGEESDEGSVPPGAITVPLRVRAATEAIGLQSHVGGCVKVRSTR